MDRGNLTPVVRFGRTVAISVIGLALSAIAHCLVTGVTPTGLVSAVPADSRGLLALICLAGLLPLGWRRRSRGAVIGTLTLMQLGQHLVFTQALGAHVGSAAGHGHVAESAATGHPGGSAMITAHLAAAGLTALIAERGEDLLRLLVHWLRWLSPVRLHSAAVVTGTGRPIPTGASGPRRRTEILLGGVGLRGPPPVAI